MAGMRVAVCSDIHGRIDRLHAFLAAAAAADVDQCWCLGDVLDALGAADPDANAECVRVVEAACAVRLAGNHEASALHRGILDDETAQICGQWPPGGVTADGIVVVHGSPRDPLMEFIHDAEAASAALDVIPGWIGLHGHTHVARLWARTADEPVVQRRRQANRPVSVSNEERVLACPGALTGSRPSFLLVDFDSRVLLWRRLATA